MTTTTGDADDDACDDHHAYDYYNYCYCYYGLNSHLRSGYYLNYSRVGGAGAGGGVGPMQLLCDPNDGAIPSANHHQADQDLFLAFSFNHYGFCFVLFCIDKCTQRAIELDDESDKKSKRTSNTQTKYNVFFLFR